MVADKLTPTPNGDDDSEVARADPDAREGEGQRPPPLEAEVLSDDEREEIAQDVSRRIMMSTMWSGRLPRPEDLEKYNSIVPGAAEKLVEDVVFESQLAQQSIEIDKSVSRAIIEIMHGNQKLEIEQSRNDREFRGKVFDWLKPLFYLPLVVVVVLMFSPIADWAKAAIAVSVIIAYIAPVCIVLLRGPMSDNEKEAMTTIVPAVVSAVRRELRTQKEPLNGDDGSPAGNNDSVKLRD